MNDIFGNTEVVGYPSTQTVFYFLLPMLSIYIFCLTLYIFFAWAWAMCVSERERSETATDWLSVCVEYGQSEVHIFKYVCVACRVCIASVVLAFCCIILMIVLDFVILFIEHECFEMLNVVLQFFRNSFIRVKLESKHNRRIFYTTWYYIYSIWDETIFAFLLILVDSDEYIRFDRSQY